MLSKKKAKCFTMSVGMPLYQLTACDNVCGTVPMLWVKTSFKPLVYGVLFYTYCNHHTLHAPNTFALMPDVVPWWWLILFWEAAAKHLQAWDPTASCAASVHSLKGPSTSAYSVNCANQCFRSFHSQQTILFCTLNSPPENTSSPAFTSRDTSSSSKVTHWGM